MMMLMCQELLLKKINYVYSGVQFQIMKMKMITTVVVQTRKTMGIAAHFIRKDNF